MTIPQIAAKFLSKIGLIIVISIGGLFLALTLSNNKDDEIL